MIVSVLPTVDEGGNTPSLNQHHHGLLCTGLATNHIKGTLTKSISVYAIFRIFSPIYLVVRQLFLAGNHCYISQISLSPNQPNFMGEISNSTTQDTGVAGLLQGK